PARWLYCEVWIVDVDEARGVTCARIGDSLRRPREPGALRSETHHNLAGHICHGLVAAVTPESQRAFELGRQIGARSDRDLLQKGESPLRAIRLHQREVRLLRKDSHFMHENRLEVSSISARRSQGGSLESRSHILGGTLIRRRPCVAALHTVPGKLLGRMPPGARVCIGNLVI